jgi:molybdopterin converting factor small subunit
MSIDILYLGPLRDAVGCARERVDPPSHVLTVEDLVRWLAERSPAHGAALADPSRIGAAVEAERAGPGDSVFGAREVALFPPPGAL